MKQLFLAQTISLFLLTVLVSGCSSRMIDFTVISTKQLEHTIPPESIGERVEGRDEGWVLLGIPFGAPEIKEAIDDALEKAGPASGYNALTDGVLYQTTKFYLVATKIRYKVEGTPVIVRLTETLIPVLDTMPALKPRSRKDTPLEDQTVLYHSSLGISNEAAITQLKIRKNQEKEKESD